MRSAFLVFCLAAVSVSTGSSPLHAQDSRADKLRRGLHDTELGGTWIYDDLKAGFSQAESTGKPLLIVFR